MGAEGMVRGRPARRRGTDKGTQDSRRVQGFKRLGLGLALPRSCPVLCLLDEMIRHGGTERWEGRGGEGGEVRYES